MRCPKCNHTRSKVIDSRSSEGDTAVRRRRKCCACNARFTTYERREEPLLMVIKHDGRREPFDCVKLKNGIMRAFVKRSVETEKISALVDEIVTEVRDRSDSEITSNTLGELVLQHLLTLDKVAYIRFASVYRDFRDVDEFTTILKGLAEQ